MEHTKPISRREEEVIALLLQGSSNKQIALALHISERTVEFHLNNIYAKYHVNSRVGLILKLGKSAGDFTEKPVESTVDIGKNIVHNGKHTGTHRGWAQSIKKVFPMNKQEFAIRSEIRTILIILTMLMGIILIAGGIMTGKNGAIVVGLISSAVAIREWITSRKHSNI